MLWSVPELNRQDVIPVFKMFSQSGKQRNNQKSHKEGSPHSQKPATYQWVIMPCLSMPSFSLSHSLPLCLVDTEYFGTHLGAFPLRAHSSLDPMKIWDILFPSYNNWEHLRFACPGSVFLQDGNCLSLLFTAVSLAPRTVWMLHNHLSVCLT